MSKPATIPFRKRVQNACMAFASAASGNRAVSAMLSGGAAFASSILNRYEGAQPYSPDRSWIPAFVRDARFDANSFARWEMARKILYFERNVWLPQKLGEIYSKYTVGPHGIPVIPDSSDSEWNKRMSDSYQTWCESPILDSALPMSHAHKQMARSKHYLGEVFILKTREKLDGKGQSIPKIQLIESHRCSSPGTIAGSDVGLSAELARFADGDHVIDGVGVDDNGKPVEYWMRDGLEGSAWLARPASQVVHIFSPERIGMYRGITPYHAVLNTINDFDDLEIMEMQRAKANAEDAKVFTTWNGELDPNMARQQRGMIGGNGATPIDHDLDKRIEQYRQVLGSRSIALRPGEDVKYPSNPSPSAAQQWYYRFKASQVCSAVSIPIILVWPDSMQGTVVRAVLDDANIFFQSEFSYFAHAAKDTYRFYAQWARYNVPGLQDAPADWNRCHAIPPRACNVDVGRNSAAKISELAVGLTSYDDEARAAGSISDDVFLRKARNVAKIKKIAKQVSIETGEQVSPAEIASPIADVLQSLALAEQANATAANLEAQAEREPATA